MHIAVRRGRMDIVMYLNENSADLNVENKVGNIHYELHNTRNGFHDIAPSKPFN